VPSGLAATPCGPEPAGTVAGVKGANNPPEPTPYCETLLLPLFAT
jgi:hypothetical protein